ncbi:HNH/endonuclease VII fold putative polymorphic toxin [Streptomyces sp. NBC_01343]|uniref:putative T7SS-secreted protein n=1 Tax=Streptomyces sp. NBC_01343 TaxID=2903832 RepID=UPI002E14A1F0|nr:HNH/endonuclease VII fold putative polymorphic toxin [Streptomyces sp. NBC_01343]
MGWRDFVPDSIEDKVEHGVERVGDAIEWAGDKTADLAEEVGLDDAGDWIRDKSRSAANQLGADVSELELGQTDDPKKLIYGSVSKIRAQVSHLDDFKAAFESVGNGLKTMTQPEGLRGKTADTFRETVAKEPPRWFKAADAFGKAADAMNRFAETVEWAQGKAKEALEEYEHAQKVSTDARNAHNKKVTAYKDAVEAKQDPLPPRPVDAKDFVDPGKALATAAQDKLDSARKQRNEVADTTATAVRAARDSAPPKPSYTQQLGDGLDYLDLATTHLVGGVVKGTAGIVNFARALNPTDPYNLTHPAEYLTNLNSTAAGLVTMANDPWGAGKQMLDEFMKDPSEGIGKMLPELIGSKGLGSLKKLGTAAKHLDDIKAVERKGPGRAGNDADGPHKGERPDCEKRCDGTDPVDLASGRMFLPQTDIVLPGVLPLAFTRRSESGYASGRWFGPTWASTIDQHLEVDAEGVVLVTEDGLAVPYPHPAPGLAVLPVSPSAPRNPLERAPDGDWTLTDPTTGHIRRFTPPGGDPDADGLAPIAQLEDRNGNLIAFEYDAEGTPVGITHHSGGYRLRFETADGRITALHLDGGPRILAYGYTAGHLTDVTNSSSRPLRFAYDQRARITSWTDTNGCSYTYAYDDLDRCIWQGGANGHMTLAFTYGEPDPRTGLRTTTTTTPDGDVRRYVVDKAYRIVESRDPLGSVTRSTYDARGRLVALTDPLQRTTVFRRDDEGRLVTVVRPDGRELITEYDEAGRPVVQTEADRTSWRFTYDERGNRTSRTSPVGATTRYTYDASGGISSVIDGLGAATRVRCDRAGLPVQITDPVGAVTHYERDELGRPVRITDALGKTTVLEWTTEGRIARRTDPDGSSQYWAYDGEGNCIRHTDALGGTTVVEYGDFDVVKTRTGPDGARHTFVHDARLRLTEVVNPHGFSWRYTYDAAGMPESETDFDGRTVRYVHDAAGRLVTRVNAAGQAVRVEYDVLDNRILKEVDGAVTRYEYDYSDRVAAITGAEGTLTYLRDRFGRTREESADGRTLLRTYDELSRVVSRTTPSGARAEWTYDAAGRRSGLTSSGRRITFERDALGRETGRRIGDAAALGLQHDELGRLLEQRLTGADGSLLQRRGYAYRADGYLVGVEDELSGARTYALDPVGRVTAVSADDWSERYAYDAAGNQTEAVWPAAHPGGPDATGPRTYEGTRLTGAGRVRYEYDAMGRITLCQRTRLSRKPDTWRYEWDAEDRLKGVTTPDGTLWRYAYDALGRRSAKRRMAADGVTVAEEVTFVWDGMTLCEQTTTSTDLPHAVTLTWDHDGLQPLAQTERLADADGREIDSRFFGIVTDLVGTPTELVDEAGEIAWRMRSTLWGTTTWNADANAYTPLRFPGQYFDPESGLHYNCLRYYDPETARYLSVDPLGLGPAPNPVAYVANPHTWSDPLGLNPCPPKGEKSNPFKLRSDAERAAFDAAGVPFGTTPDAEWIVMGDKTLKNMPGHVYSSDPTHWGNFRQFETPNGSRVVVEHTDDPAGPHFHAGGPKGSTIEDQSRSGVNFGWDNTVDGYGTMERYRAIDKPGGDHHFFYEEK